MLGCQAFLGNRGPTARRSRGSNAAVCGSSVSIRQDHHEGGKVYWTIDSLPEGIQLVNRCDEAQTYELRLAAGTLPRR